MRNGDELKGTSVPDFRRTGRSLQFGRVKWSSPRHFTHSFYSLHLGVRRTSWDQERWQTIRYAAKVKIGRERPHPFDAWGVTGLRGVAPAPITPAA